MEAVDVRGKFVWHQLMTRDVPGAKDFYARLVGWKTLAWPLDPAYTVCHAEAGPVAGIMEISSDMPSEVQSHWLQYIGTRDVDSTAQAAVRAGGSIVKGPSDMQGAGRYAVLKDPQGAVFAIIDPENAKPDAEGAPPLGAFSWHELATSDNEAAFAFYSGLFGWDALQRMDMGPVGVYLIFGENGVQRGGMYIKPAENPGPPSWLPYAHVPDADRGYALAVSKGAKGTVPPMDVPGGGRIANMIDPSGASFAVHSLGASMPKAAPAAKSKAAAKPQAAATIKVKAKAKPKPKAIPKKAAPARKKSSARKKGAKNVAKAKKGLKKFVKAALKKYRAAKKKSAPRKKSKSVRRKK
jgi:predicted enzyme related to lactoylglutathione lyase